MRKLPVYLVVDVSESMIGDAQRAVYKGIVARRFAPQPLRVRDGLVVGYHLFDEGKSSRAADGTRRLQYAGS